MINQSIDKVIKGVIGACIYDCDIYSKCNTVLNTEIFTDKLDRAIWNYLGEYYKHSTMIDVALMMSQIDAEYALIDDYQSNINSSNLENRLSHILNYQRYSGFNDSLKRVIGASMDSWEDLYQQFVTRVDKIRSDTVTEDEGLMKDIVLELIKFRDFNLLNPGIRGVSTGFSKLDAFISGFEAGRLITIAARPGMGKTTLAINMMLASNDPVVFFSLEMSKIDVAAIMLSILSGLDLESIRAGHYHDKLEPYFDELMAKDIFVFDATINDIKRIEYKIRYMVHRFGVRCVYIDYVQIIKNSASTTSLRTYQIGELSSTLKALANELKIAIVILGQISREHEKKGRREPFLSDIKDSGSLEQDSDIVMLWYRESYYDSDTEKEHGCLYLAKNRFGDQAKIFLDYDNRKFSQANQEGVPETEGPLPF